MDDAFEPNGTFCCKGLQQLIANAGQRGLSVLVWKSPEKTTFLFQSRGIDIKDETKLKLGPLDLILNVSNETALNFCPFCGRALAELLEKSGDFFSGLAKQHSALLPPILKK